MGQAVPGFRLEAVLQPAREHLGLVARIRRGRVEEIVPDVGKVGRVARAVQKLVDQPDAPIRGGAVEKGAGLVDGGNDAVNVEVDAAKKLVVRAGGGDGNLLLVEADL